MLDHNGCLLPPCVAHPCRRETPALTIEELEEIAARERMRCRRIYYQEFAEEALRRGDYE